MAPPSWRLRAHLHRERPQASVFTGRSTGRGAPQACPKQPARRGWRTSGVVDVPLNTHTHSHMHAYTQRHAHSYTNTHTYTCIHIYTHIHIYSHTRIHTCTLAHSHTHMCTCSCMFKHLYTHIPPCVCTHSSYAYVHHTHSRTPLMHIYPLVYIHTLRHPHALRVLCTLTHASVHECLAKSCVCAVCYMRYAAAAV